MCHGRFRCICRGLDWFHKAVHSEVDGWTWSLRVLAGILFTGILFRGCCCGVEEIGYCTFVVC